MRTASEPEPPSSFPPGHVEVALGEERAFLVLIGEVDVAVVPDMHAAIDELVRAGLPVDVDCSMLSFIDSSAVGCLSLLAQSVPTRPRVLDAPPMLEHILRITGIDALVDITR